MPTKIWGSPSACGGVRGPGFYNHVTKSHPGESGQGSTFRSRPAQQDPAGGDGLRVCRVAQQPLPLMGLERLQCGWGGGGATFGLDLILIYFSLNGHPWLIGRASGRRWVRSPEPGRSASRIQCRVSPAAFMVEPRKDEALRSGVSPRCPAAPRRIGSAIDDRHVKSDGP